ncbi:hypothetical protein ACXNAL_16375 [Kluyvera ascorbata]|uniref:hypothetical protein n=1 Tax=Kluyvera TaxID=579 RepID=UPI0022E799AC|nr:hypothetical protein [Kluyvera ascorbata]HDG1675022.1 hypothetical protein [Kluyvera cryocrescens]HEF0063574.1 hypothetical protein [Citrobacter pasteurii]
MTPRLPFAFAVFLGSYLPLSMILLIQDFDDSKYKRHLCFDLLTSDSCNLPFKEPLLSVSLFLICLVCFLISWLILKLAKSDEQKIRILEVKYTPSDLMNYVLPYIVSFMSINYQETNKFFGFIVFLLWLFWLSYKTGQIILNPILIVFNWKMYEVTYRHPGSKNTHSGVVLSNLSISPDSDYEYQTIQSVIIISGDKDET